MKTLIRNMVSALVILLLPTVASGDSLADKKSDTPVETWNNQEIELERAILTETIEPTAAGHSAYEGSFSAGQDGMNNVGETGGMGSEHGAKEYKRASDYKREVFGPN